MPQAWKIKKAGSLDSLQCIEQNLPQLKSAEVKIKVKAIGLNFADIFAIQGLYSATPKGSFIPGLEFSGEIIEAHSTITDNYKVGDRVMGVTRFGAYTNEININISHLWKLPDEWSCKEGAAFPVQAFTAWYGLIKLGNLQSKQTVLVHSAAGGVGYWALEIIDKMGSTAICTIGNEEKVQFLKDHFSVLPSQIIIRSKKNFKTQIENLLRDTKKDGLDIVFDAIYGPYFQAAYKCMNPGGRHIIYGAATLMTQGIKPNYLQVVYRYLKRYRPDPLEMISDNKSIMGFNLIWLWDRIEELQGEFLDMMGDFQRRPHIDRVFSFAEMKEAIQHLQTGKTKGKVVVET